MHRFALLCCLFLSLPALAGVNPEETLEQDRNLLLGAGNIQLLRDGLYEVSAESQIAPLSFETVGVETKNSEHKTIGISPKQPFALKVRGNVVEVVPLIANEAVGAVPDHFRFRLDDVLALKLLYLGEGDSRTLYERFTEDAETQLAGRCKFFVEKHFGFHVDGICASQMSADKLARVGFHSTSCDSAQLKVWGGGHGVRGHRGGCGHVAWRTGGGNWSSGDFVGDPGSGYYTIGCYSRH